MLKCLAPEAFRYAHELHLPSGICLLCRLAVLEPLEWSGLPNLAQKYSRPGAEGAASGATERINVPQPIPLKQTFPGLSSAWARSAPILPSLEYITVKIPKPTGVTNITPGDNEDKTAPCGDILALHFNLEEIETVDAQTVEDEGSGGSGATDANTPDTV